MEFQFLYPAPDYYAAILFCLSMIIFALNLYNRENDCRHRRLFYVAFIPAVVLIGVSVYCYMQPMVIDYTYKDKLVVIDENVEISSNGKTIKRTLTEVKGCVMVGKNRYYGNLFWPTVFENTSRLEAEVPCIEAKKRNEHIK